MQVNFSVKLMDLALTFFPRENLLIAKINATSLGKKVNANFKNFVNLTEFFETVAFLHQNQIV